MNEQLQTAFDVACRVYGLASAITWAEGVVVARRGEAPWLSMIVRARVVATVTGVLVLALPHSDARDVLMIFLAVAAVFGALRGHAGRDASDDMQMVIGVSLCVGAGPWADATLRAAALTAITAHLVICYLVAGLAKAGTERWRSGLALKDVLMTDAFGLGQRTNRFDRSLLHAGRVVVIGELVLPLALLAGGPLTLAAAVAGMGFHIVVAATMGLSRFPATWAAGYVAVLWWSGQHGLLS